MTENVSDSYNEIKKYVKSEEHNCFRCNGIKIGSDCNGREYLPSVEMRGVCSWYLVAQNDLNKYHDNIPELTLGNMLSIYLKGIKKE